MPSIVDNRINLAQVLTGEKTPHDYQETLRRDQDAANNVTVETTPGVPEPNRVKDYTKRVFQADQSRIKAVVRALCAAHLAIVINNNIESRGEAIIPDAYDVEVSVTNPDRRFIINVPYGTDVPHPGT